MFGNKDAQATVPVKSLALARASMRFHAISVRAWLRRRAAGDRRRPTGDAGGLIRD
ncbi:hypothetical protein [Caulobacter sp. Root655]|uniref:hypothetical protein n=1 Tax=Caulobacter sp. Root655 TaxID=1736578 RepID=UPI000A5AFA5C|nr:hypothetical protein [Caulobacter sp. Root655]